MTEFLYREFCNHVYLGQWELARACALALINNETSKDSKQLLFTLQNIAKNPHLVRSAWTTVSNPSYFSFLSCQLLLDIKCPDEVKTWRKLADFHILLENFFQDSKSVLAELSSTHSHLLRFLNEVSGTKIIDSSFVISNESIFSLKNAFAENPIAISQLLNMIHVPKDLNVDSNINLVICDIHCQHLLKCLKSVKSTSVKSNKSNNLRESILNIYFLLSILPTFAIYMDVKRGIHEVFSFVLQLCESKILDINRVYQSFLCQSTPGLYQYFNDFQKNKLAHGSDEDFYSSKRFPKCFSSDGHFSHQNALLNSIDSSSHFLQDLMDFFMESIICGKWMYVENTLNDSLLSVLKPLLLILSWRICQNDASAMNVIQAVKDWNGLGFDPVLEKACQQLKLNTSLTDLCINLYKDLYPEAKHTDIHHKTRNILSNLQTQSTLKVIHSTFGLKNVPPERVTQMLSFTQVEKSAEYSNMSIRTAELPERASCLLQYVNEALWRYEVVKSGIFQGTFGMSPLQKKKPYLFQSQLSASSSDGTDVESKKRKKKKKQKRSFSSLKKESFAESSIIQCMLSSPEALLRYSLWSRNLTQAQQVIKLFHLETSNEAKELILIQELRRISGKLAKMKK
ncbi:zinc finger FYVE domain-containing protein 26 [Trichonephila inaurata madagascariensis]|uniref:Zinc finger FYVE domain-containing protein 26 n=1 Tax=Trichonephila inaurata madagascariensis TaxID=2747483 RepID=A0A8X6JXR2_9ARAC|nr:zinc finger FYVE domain-containing protein 26 [Trichonephila inaurata madagascariensis]